jgi:hypothetical protein
MTYGKRNTREERVELLCGAAIALLSVVAIGLVWARRLAA